MYFARRSLIVILLTGLLLTSCGGQSADAPTPDLNAILTAGVGTLAASIFQTQTALVPSATATSTVTLTPTNTPLPLLSPPPTSTQLILLSTVFPNLTPSPTGTQYTPTVNPSSLGVGCNNLRLINDVSIPSGTVMDPGELFTKTWQVENNGTCDWVYLYHLVFVSGDSMGGGETRLGKIIPPGKWTQISVALEAPRQEGRYSGTWRFADQAGNLFGSSLGVSIVVRRPTYP